MDPKQILKIASAMRKAGIKTYRQGDVEITIEYDGFAPKKRAPRSAKGSANSVVDAGADIDSETLPYEDLLHWSVGGNEEQAG